MPDPENVPCPPNLPDVCRETRADARHTLRSETWAVMRGNLFKKKGGQLNPRSTGGRPTFTF